MLTIPVATVIRVVAPRVRSIPSSSPPGEPPTQIAP
jgi:hypothetical protein